MENDWRQYFAFTRKERTGIIILVVLIIVSVGLQRLIPALYKLPEGSNPGEIKALIAGLEMQQADSAEARVAALAAVYDPPENKDASKPGLFEFDPNTLDTKGWRKLGLPDRTTRIIQNYIAKGGRFRKPGDLARIYSLRQEDFERLLPYIKIPQHNANDQPKEKQEITREYKRTVPTIAVIDINQADTAAWIALPGIGPALARRIVHFREKLGGFYSVGQVAETYGVPDSTFRLIKQYLQCISPDVRTININTADVQALRQHPYIKWPLANAIVQYRQQHGPYRSPVDIQQIAVVTPEIFEKIVPYLTVE